jgi:PAS domain S-box-containing protein
VRTPRGLKAIPGGKDAVIESAEESNKYQILFEQASDAILTVLDSGKIDAANHAVEEMTGFLKDELVGSPIAILVPETGKTLAKNRERSLNPEQFKIAGTYEDVAIQRKDGFIRFVDINVRVLSNGKSVFSLALLRDLTEKKRMEREVITKHTELRQAYIELEKKNVELQSMQETLVQSGKMAALGELAAGIAHELNQPLQGIRGYAQEIQTVAGPLLEKKKEKAEIDLGLKEIISNVEKMASIIEHMRIFIRRSTEKHEFVDVHNAIDVCRCSQCH